MIEAFAKRKHRIFSFNELRRVSQKKKTGGRSFKKEGAVSIDPVVLMDKGKFRELGSNLVGTDPLDFPGYEEKLEAARTASGKEEAVTVGFGQLDKRLIAVAVLHKEFMMGSMSSAVGEKITRLTEAAARHHAPLLIISASGGARMQEGLFSLLQMAKTSAAIQRYKDKGGLYISYLMHPTTGGVSASFAMLGDIILAEPDALIGFAGPRVIEQTIGEKLPEGFQRSAFQVEHGFVDRIVKPEDLREELVTILKLHPITSFKWADLQENK